MTDGFKIKLDTDELRQHCADRADHHARRADEKEASLPRLEAALNDVAAHKKTAVSNVSNMNKGSYSFDKDEPIEDLKKDIEEHRNKVLVFRFFAAHLIDGDYVLSEVDLQRLEILKRW